MTTTQPPPRDRSTPGVARALATAEIPTTDELLSRTLRNEITALLSECTERQQAFFTRIFPTGVNRLTEDKLRSAHDLCRRTVEKNRAGR